MNQEDARVVAEEIGDDWARQLACLSAQSSCGSPPEGGCIQCIESEERYVPHFTPENYLRVIEWAREQEWWPSLGRFEDMPDKLQYIFRMFVLGWRDCGVDDVVAETISALAQAIRQHKDK